MLLMIMMIIMMVMVIVMGDLVDILRFVSSNYCETLTVSAVHYNDDEYNYDDHHDHQAVCDDDHHDDGGD